MAGAFASSATARVSHDSDRRNVSVAPQTRTHRRARKEGLLYFDQIERLTMTKSRKQEWWEWHKANPHVYDLFKHFTFRAIERGHTKLSAWLIINRIRWETAIETKGGDFKISNDYIAYYSRLFMAHHPRYKGFFVIKKMKYE